MAVFYDLSSRCPLRLRSGSDVNDIFISYASGDRDRVKPLVDALQQQGWTVWWDRTIRPGEIFDRVIEAAMKDSRCAIVIWSHKSVESDWVRNEAHEANRRKILVPAVIDEVAIPLAFATIQYANLIGWAGGVASAQFDELARAVRVVLGSSTPTSSQSATPPSQAAKPSSAMAPEPLPGEAPKEADSKPQPDPKATEEKATEKARKEEERKAAAAEKVLLEKANKARSEREKRKPQAAAKRAEAKIDRLAEEEARERAFDRWLTKGRTIENASALCWLISLALAMVFGVLKIRSNWQYFPFLLMLVALIIGFWKNPPPGGAD